MTPAFEHIAGSTWHGRRGPIRNAFRYGVDYVLIDPEVEKAPFLFFSRNGLNLTSVLDRNHGGAPGAGRGVAWTRDVLEGRGLDLSDVEIRLLTQPGYLGYVFNPVSFWLAFRDEALVAVIAEVNNTFGDRHSYLCMKPDFSQIEPDDKITAHKVMHVSPFQEVAGDYVFNFRITQTDIFIRIAHRNGADGLIATLEGRRAPLSDWSLIGASLRRPAGALRTITLIYWQALRLKLKGAQYRTRPAPPSEEVT